MDDFQRYTLKLAICFGIVLIVIGAIDIYKGMKNLKEQTNEMIFEQEYINFCLEDSLK